MNFIPIVGPEKLDDLSAVRPKTGGHIRDLLANDARYNPGERRDPDSSQGRGLKSFFGEKARTDHIIRFAALNRCDDRRQLGGQMLSVTVKLAKAIVVVMVGVIEIAGDGTHGTTGINAVGDDRHAQVATNRGGGVARPIVDDDDVEAAVVCAQVLNRRSDVCAPRCRR